MQYMLTQEEFDNLKNLRYDSYNKIETKLQEVCTLACNSIPVSDGEPWGCILTTKHEWYCDDCPVQDFCPYQYKEWSK